VNVIAKYTDYLIFSPDFFIDYISTEIHDRDISGLTNGRVSAINVTGEHPMVQLVGSIMSTGDPNFAGLLPSISVTESDENEENTTIGHGLREYESVDQTWVDNIKNNYPKLRDRTREGIITDKQIQAIETALTNSTEGKLITEVRQFYERQSVFISLWTHNIHERQIIGGLLRSILYDLRLEMIEKKLRDISIKTSKGLVNFNFGRVLYGQESEISYMSSFRNFTVYDEEEIDHDLAVKGEFTTINSLDETYKFS